MFTCIIVDDDLVSTTNLRRLISSRTDLSLLRTFTNPCDALDYLRENDVDIIFLDIYLPEIKGIQFAKIHQSDSLIIFTTVSDKEAFEAFGVNAIDYLLKPISITRFNAAVEKTKPFLTHKEIAATIHYDDFSKKTISIIADRKVYKIPFDEIYFIESQSEYVCYYTKKIKLLSLGALKGLSDLLPHEFFVRIHKSYIINIIYLRSYTAASITLNNDIVLPIGRVYRDQFKLFATNHLN